MPIPSIAVYGPKASRSQPATDDRHRTRRGRRHDAGPRADRARAQRQDSCAPRTTRPPRPPTCPARPSCSRPTAWWCRTLLKQNPARSSTASSSWLAALPTSACSMGEQNLAALAQRLHLSAVHERRARRLTPKYRKCDRTSCRLCRPSDVRHGAAGRHFLPPRPCPLFHSKITVLPRANHDPPCTARPTTSFDRLRQADRLCRYSPFAARRCLGRDPHPDRRRRAMAPGRR